MSWLESFSHVQRNCDGMRSDWLCRCWNVVDPRLMSTSVSPDDGNGARPTDPASIITVPAEKKLDPTLDFLAGTAAGISGLVVGFPFDTGGPSFVFFPSFPPQTDHSSSSEIQIPKPIAKRPIPLHLARAGDHHARGTPPWPFQGYLLSTGASGGPPQAPLRLFPLPSS